MLIKKITMSVYLMFPNKYNNNLCGIFYLIFKLGYKFLNFYTFLATKIQNAKCFANFCNFTIGKTVWCHTLIQEIFWTGGLFLKSYGSDSYKNVPHGWFSYTDEKLYSWNKTFVYGKIQNFSHRYTLHGNVSTRFIIYFKLGW